MKKLTIKKEIRSKSITLGEIASLINGKLIGEQNIIIRKASSIEDACPDSIVFVLKDKYLESALSSQASAVVVKQEGLSKYQNTRTPEMLFPKPIIYTANPKLALANVLQFFAPSLQPKAGIHSTAILGQDVIIDKGVSIGPYVTIGDRVHISNNVTIYPQVYIGDEVTIEEGSIIYPRVTLGHRIKIGQNVIIHSGAVIGSDGFGYVEAIDRKHQKIPQIGGVIIGNDVEIGANTTIDRATIGNTIIGQGTKIDNLVQIAHNVQIGKNCLIIAHVGISGSVQIQDNVILAGQSGVADHVKIKQGTIVAGRAVVTKDVGPNIIISGFPAREHHKELKTQALISQLDSLFKRVKRLEGNITVAVCE